MRADGQTDMKKLTVALRNFVNPPNNRRAAKQYRNPRAKGTSEDERL